MHYLKQMISNILSKISTKMLRDRVSLRYSLLYLEVSLLYFFPITNFCTEFKQSISKHIILFPEQLTYVRFVKYHYHFYICLCI